MTHPDSKNLRLMLALAAAGFAGAVVLPEGIIRAFVTLPLVIFLPGYAMLRAVRPDLNDRPAVMCLASGLSLSLTILTGFFLNVSGLLGGGGFVWAAPLAAFTAIFLVVALARRGERLAPAGQPWVHLTGEPGWKNYRQPAMIAATVSLIAAAGFLAFQSASHTREFSYSELWLLPNSFERPEKLTVGIRNMEPQTNEYSIELQVDNALVATWNGITLDAGESWTKDYKMDPVRIGEQRAEATLYKTNDPHRLLRRVWLNARNPM